MEQDIRWEQRFSNFEKALQKLDLAVKYIRQNILTADGENMDRTLDEMIREGLIQRFEYTHELAWNVMKDYAEYQGNPNVGGSRDATREAFELKLISNGSVWMDMILSRNQTSHTYNEQIAEEIYSKILNEYYPEFLEFQVKMDAKSGGKQGKIF